MRKKQVWQWIEFVTLFFFLVIFFCNGLNSILFQPDESQWIATSCVYEDYFHGNFQSSLWNESYWTLTQPPLPRYVIGVGRTIGGISASNLNAPWDWHKDKSTNIAEGRLPSDRLLWWSRVPMGVLAALAIFIVFFTLTKLLGRLPAYIWILLCLQSSFFPTQLCRAMGEAPLLACIAVILFISIKLLQCADNRKISKNPERLYIYILFLGIAIGLAQSSKLNGLAAIGAGFAIVLIIAFRMKRLKLVKLRFGLISSLILIFSTQLTFLLLNPYLWKQPLVRTSRMFENRIWEMKIQQLEYPESKIEGFSDHVQLVIHRIFDSYSAIHFNGALWINIIFFLIGLTYLIVMAAQYLKRGNPNAIAVVVLLVGMTTSTPSLFTPLDWDRYYLLPVYFSTLVIAIGIWLFGLRVYKSIRKQIILNTYLQC